MKRNHPVEIPWIESAEKFFIPGSQTPLTVCAIIVLEVAMHRVVPPVPLDENSAPTHFLEVVTNPEKRRGQSPPAKQKNSDDQAFYCKKNRILVWTAAATPGKYR